MVNPLSFEQSTLQLLFSQEEYCQFREIVAELCSAFPDIKGAFMTGSLTQKIGLPDPPASNEDLGELARAYASIVGRTRRKLFPHIDSDLDFWILTEEQDGNERIQPILNERALDLLQWYSSQGDEVDMVEWIHLKRRAFDEFYKKPFLYSDRWLATSSNPAHAIGFKAALEEKIGKSLPKLRAKIDYYFRKGSLGQFIETRSFPASVFNLKTEKIPIMNSEDRTPFPFYLRDWVDLERNCLILYSSGDTTSLIYPFNPNGVVPGEKIATSINWTPRHIDSVLYKEGRKSHDDLKHF